MSSVLGEIEGTLADLDPTGGRRYRFKFGTKAMVELQEMLSPPGRVLPIEEILTEAFKGRLKYVQAWLWSGLRKYHPEVTMANLEDLLDSTSEKEIRRLLSAMGLVAAPDPEDLQELGVKAPARPQKAQARKKAKGGTGENSTSTLAVSV